MNLIKKNFSKIVFGLVALFVFAIPMFSLAALQTPVPPVTGNAITLDKLERWISQIATFLITISMVLAVIIIIWGGINYMFARGDDTKLKSAKAMIINGIIGAAVILGVGLILRTLQLLVQSQTFFN